MDRAQGGLRLYAEADGRAFFSSLDAAFRTLSTDHGAAIADAASTEGVLAGKYATLPL